MGVVVQNTGHLVHVTSQMYRVACHYVLQSAATVHDSCRTVMFQRFICRKRAWKMQHVVCKGLHKGFHTSTLVKGCRGVGQSAYPLLAAAAMMACPTSDRVITAKYAWCVAGELSLLSVMPAVLEL